MTTATVSPDLIAAGMWGTTHLRAYLLEVDAHGVSVRDERPGPGVSCVRPGEFRAVFDAIFGAWRGAHDIKGVFLAGMVGSNIGWRHVEYAACPVSVADLVRLTAIEDLSAPTYIAAGLRAENRFGRPDVMRGEELELAGWAAQAGELSGDHLVCLPGTHAKWVTITDGVIIGFTTAISGQMFADIAASGILVRGETEPANSEAPHEAFLEAVSDIAADPSALVHRLFSVRAEQVAGSMTPAQALERLSGLLIGAEVAYAVQNQADAAPAIALIGDAALCGRYKAALEHLGQASDIFTSRDVIPAGFAQMLAKTA